MTNTQPKNAPPPQALPIDRNTWTEPAGPRNESGVEAAKSLCASLPDPARQMCYAAEYGITT